MSTAAASHPALNPVVTANDRLGFLLVFSTALHAIIILGVVFGYTEPKDDADPPPIEVLLVQTRNDQAPEEADYYAQENQLGSGTLEEKARPSSPFASPLPASKATIAADSGSPEKSIRQINEKPEDVLTTKNSPETVTQEEFQEKQEKLLDSPKDSKENKLQTEIASLTAEISRSLEEYAKRPRKTWITSASAKQWIYASYMQAWQAKVEKIGNLNYPDEALRNKISGRVILDVAINWDGSVQSVMVEQSSGSAVLDQAAKRIVKLSSPFAPFPPNIRKKTDILHITRAWIFHSGEFQTK